MNFNDSYKCVVWPLTEESSYQILWRSVNPSYRKRMLCMVSRWHSERFKQDLGYSQCIRELLVQYPVRPTTRKFSYFFSVTLLLLRVGAWLLYSCPAYLSPNWNMEDHLLLSECRTVMWSGNGLREEGLSLMRDYQNLVHYPSQFKGW